MATAIGNGALNFSFLVQESDIFSGDNGLPPGTFMGRSGVYI